MMYQRSVSFIFTLFVIWTSIADSYTLLDKIMEPAGPNGINYLSHENKQEDSSWLRSLLNNKNYYNLAADKRAAPEYRFLQASMPNKRNDGMWIWMPSQGYVSVPKDPALDDATGKNGKILRYGK